MDEYIDREDYCKNLCHCHNEYCDKESCPIWKAPAADVAPVRHGKWIPFHSEIAGDIWYCSACGIGFTARMAHCPRCGAWMDGEEDG